MDEREIQRRIAAGEDSETELKSARQRDGKFSVNAESIAESVAAFANTDGGCLLVGVEDGGAISGCGTSEDCDAIQRQIVSACRDLIRPGLYPNLRSVIVGGQRVLVVTVPAFVAGRPFGVNGRYRLRVGPTKQDATPADLRRMLQAADFHFDEEPVRGATRTDLDAAALHSAYGAATAGRDPGPGVESWLCATHCVAADGTPTVAGLLMFGAAPQTNAVLIDARIVAVRVPGVVPSMTFSDRQEFVGPLPVQFAAAVEFLQRHTENRSVLQGTQRIDERLPGIVPDSAVREVVLNALCHRDYSIASPVRIVVYDDRIEVTSPGDLVNRLTIAAIKVGTASISRNPVLSGRLRRHVLGREGLAFGIPTMIEVVKSVGLPEPEFEVLGGVFRVTISTVQRARA